MGRKKTRFYTIKYCKYCKKSFETVVEKRQFCSKKCSNRYHNALRQIRITLICKQCKQQFKVKNKYKNVRLFCSLSCWYIFMSKNHNYINRVKPAWSNKDRQKLSIKMSGKNNPMYGKIAYPKSRFIKDLGHTVRSTWEETVCRKLKSNNIIYYYELYTYRVRINNTEMTYTPDIVIPTNYPNVHIEVKGPLFDLQLKKMKYYKRYCNKFTNKFYIITGKSNISKVSFADRVFDYYTELDDFIKYIKQHHTFEINNLIYEGVDATGKDSLIDAFNKLTNKSWPNINRLFGSIYTYSNHFKRDNINYEKMFEIEDSLVFNNSVLVYVTADTDVIWKRQLKKDDNDIEYKDIDLLKNQYEKYLKKTKLFTIRIDTTHNTPEECAKILLSKLNTIGINPILK